MSKTVVVDTSVFVSALIGTRGPSREIVRRCLIGKYEPLISNALFQELEEVCFRPRIIRKCPLTENEVREILNTFYSVCNWFRYIIFGDLMFLVYLVPYVEDEDEVFLKTIIPSRKFTRLYLGE